MADSRDILLTEAYVYDQGNGNRQPLTGGVVVLAGDVRVEEVWSNLNPPDSPAGTGVPLAAWIISEDESAIYPGTPTHLDFATPNHKWKFEWATIPPVGCNATLRIKEVYATGATVNIAVHVVSELGATHCTAETE